MTAKIHLIQSTRVSDGHVRILEIGHMRVPRDYQDPQWDRHLVLRGFDTRWQRWVSEPVRFLWASLTDEQKAALAANFLKIDEDDRKR